ncbi:hypothetical protein DPMN_184916 [Dreissena polymorpha]|uniref:Uncharacterized protein n=1 Tax=Dreissena polymorpha TaxID=45954 RepID=A0A9D4DL80_DREPO|nr:hypothetical protein DPMN_184916 [Dreissena polymorpha]
MIRPSFANEVTDGRTATRTTLTDGRTDGQTDRRTDGRTDAGYTIIRPVIDGRCIGVGVGTGDGLVVSSNYLSIYTVKLPLRIKVLKAKNLHKQTHKPTNQPTNQQTGQKQYVPHYSGGGHTNNTEKPSLDIVRKQTALKFM